MHIIMQNCTHAAEMGSQRLKKNNEKKAAHFKKARCHKILPIKNVSHSGAISVRYIIDITVRDRKPHLIGWSMRITLDVT